MTERVVQLVLHYDGGAFAGWQRQPVARTVQGVLEEALASLTGGDTAVLGAGRTDAGVHARGQSAGVRLPERWTSHSIRRALNAKLPSDVWVAAAYEMRGGFHARFDALSRHYSYFIGTDEDARSPFRRRWEWAHTRSLSRELLSDSASALPGTHAFRAFAVHGTAPADDDHRCTVLDARWSERSGGVLFTIEANRFLHHMVRFLVGTMIEIAAGRRDPQDMRRLLEASDNQSTSAPAPAHGLFLDSVRYPAELYVEHPASPAAAVTTPAGPLFVGQA
jgi:tRNA pseudouridine38-40 synthase